MRHENYTNKKVRSVSIIVAIVMFITMLTAVITQGFTDFNPYGWFKDKEETNVPETSDNLQFGYDNTGLMTMTAKLIAPSDYEEYGVTLENIESAYELTAIITPENTTYKEVDWFIAWKNPNSTFANGKTVTDYVIVTPVSDGALEAVVECKQDFGEVIEITVQYRYDETVKAVATVDYVKKIYDISTVNGEELVNERIVNGTDNVAYTDSYFGYKYTNYTIDSSYTFNVRINFHDYFESALRIRFTRFGKNTANVPESSDGTYEVRCTGDFIRNLFVDLDTIDETSAKASYETALMIFKRDKPDDAIAQLIINAEDAENGVSFTKTIDIYTEGTTAIFATDLDFANSSIKF